MSKTEPVSNFRPEICMFPTNVKIPKEAVESDKPESIEASDDKKSVFVTKDDNDGYGILEFALDNMKEDFNSINFTKLHTTPEEQAAHVARKKELSDKYNGFWGNIDGYLKYAGANMVEDFDSINFTKLHTTPEEQAAHLDRKEKLREKYLTQEA